MVPRDLINISLKFKCKIHIQKEVIFKNHILVMWAATNLLT